MTTTAIIPRMVTTASNSSSEKPRGDLLRRMELVRNILRDPYSVNALGGNRHGVVHDFHTIARKAHGDSIDRLLVRLPVLSSPGYVRSRPCSSVRRAIGPDEWSHSVYRPRH